jgi:hypothetical protein
MTLRSPASAIVVPFALVFGLFAATTAIGEPTTELARGAALLAPFKANLQQALRAGLAEGAVEAVGACRIRAPEIAGNLSRDGVRVGRSSHRLRNPANAPPDWVKPLLDEYAADPSDRKPKSQALSEGRVGYVEPIATQPLCLTCHGDGLEPDLAARITSLYPKDEAVGFRAGDLRGVFWAEFPRSD